MEQKEDVVQALRARKFAGFGGAGGCLDRLLSDRLLRQVQTLCMLFCSEHMGWRQAQPGG